MAKKHSIWGKNVVNGKWAKGINGNNVWANTITKEWLANMGITTAMQVKNDSRLTGGDREVLLNRFFV